MSTIKYINGIHPSGSTNNLVFDSSGNTTAGGTVVMGSSFLRNRIINGAMVIDQRNAGAAITPTTGGYGVDRWSYSLSQASKYSIQQNAGSVTPPAGFPNYLGITSLSAYSIGASDYFGIAQGIEGFNFADLAFGTASAKTVTISFWVYSSLTGTFGGSFKNYAGTRSYPFSYTISAANTWEQKTITIAGDTSGTWVGNTNAGAAQVWFSFGVGSTYSAAAGSWASGLYISATGATSVVGTNGATFYITGVQLEAGSVATPFERRQYGQELMLCQRYYYKIKAEGVASVFGVGFAQSTTVAIGMTNFPVTMRVAPTALEQSGTAGDYRVFFTAGTACSSVPTLTGATGTPWGVSTAFTVASGLTTNSGVYLSAVNSSAYLAWSAEL